VKNLWKIYRLFGFCFFVISTSILGSNKVAIGLAKQDIVLLAKKKYLASRIFRSSKEADNSKRLAETVQLHAMG
jgi:hypothetical protein